MFQAAAHDGCQRSDTDDGIFETARRAARGDDDAATLLWGSCFPLLVQTLRELFGGRSRPVVDEEDLALEVFQDVIQQMRLDGVTSGASENDFMARIVVAAKWKFLMHLRAERRQKRRGTVGTDYGAATRTERLSLESPPAAQIEYLDEVRMLVGMLPLDGNSVAVAGWRLDGLTCLQIADATGLSKRNVERIWAEVLATWRRCPAFKGMHHRSYAFGIQNARGARGCAPPRRRQPKLTRLDSHAEEAREQRRKHRALILCCLPIPSAHDFAMQGHRGSR